MARTVVVPKHLIDSHGRALAAAGDLTIVEPGAPGADAAVGAFISVEGISGPEARALVDIVQHAPLEWVHIGWAGTDHPFVQAIGARGITVTNASGAGARSVGHHAIALWLALDRKIAASVRAQAERRWEPMDGLDLEARRVTVVGLGPIGLEIVRVASALGSSVLGLRRHPRGDEGCEVWTLDRLEEAAGRTDVLMVVLPLADETTGIVSAAVLDALPEGAVIVNVGRGALIDEAAMTDRLASGALAGAGLDVFETEPLPEDNRLWSLENVIVTPHHAGKTDGTNRRADESFVENLRRFAAGEPLQQVAF